MLIVMVEVWMQLTRRIFWPFPLSPEYMLVGLPLIAVDYCEFGRDLRSTREREWDEIKINKTMGWFLANRPWS